MPHISIRWNHWMRIVKRKNNSVRNLYEPEKINFENKRTQIISHNYPGDVAFLRLDFFSILEKQWAKPHSSSPVSSVSFILPTQKSSVKRTSTQFMHFSIHQKCTLFNHTFRHQITAKMKYFIYCTVHKFNGIESIFPYSFSIRCSAFSIFAIRGCLTK